MTLARLAHLYLEKTAVKTLFKLIEIIAKFGEFVKLAILEILAILSLFHFYFLAIFSDFFLILFRAVVGAVFWTCRRLFFYEPPKISAILNNFAVALLFAILKIASVFYFVKCNFFAFILK